MDKKKWIIPYLQQFRGLFALSILLGTLTVLFSGALMFTSGYLITKASTRPESILMVYVPIVGVRTFGIGRAVLSYVQRLTGHQMVLKVLSEMRVRLYNLLEPQALFLRSRFLTGDLLGVLANDIEHLQDFYLKTLFPSLVSLGTYALIVICTGAYSASFAVLLAVLIGILLFLAPFLSLLYSKIKNKQLKKGRNLLYQQFTDAILGISDWIFSGSHRGFIEKYEKNEEQLLQIEKSQHLFINWRDVINQGILGLIVVLSVYWASQQASSGVFEPTFIAAVSLAMLSLLESFLPLSSAVSDTSSYRESIFRLNQIQENGSIPNQKEIDDASVLPISQPLNLEIKSLTYHYLNGPSLMETINLNIGSQEKVAIIGRSGTGKSTLLKLIQGALSPTEGEILLNKVNVKELVPTIPKLMSVLNQKPYLFNTSVLNNIRLGNPSASDEEVYEAAKRVHLHDMVIKLPNGYDTNMHETGERFSGGERQRIALARVLLQETPIVIMDEPTVGLDPLTEKKLLADIFEVLKGKMIVWVTHHLAGVEKMDRILFLDEGKIVMDGNHQELLKSQARYRRLYQLDRPFDLEAKNRPL
jgi:ATP-binding cassette subfamily C protein CydC